MFGSLNRAKNLFFFMQKFEKFSVPRGGGCIIWSAEVGPQGGGVLFGGEYYLVGDGDQKKGSKIGKNREI